MIKKTAMVNARMEPELKIEAEKILHQMGLSSAEAIRLFYHQICLQKTFPMDLKVPHSDTSEAIRELESGRGRRYASTQAMWDDIDRA